MDRRMFSRVLRAIGLRILLEDFQHPIYVDEKVRLTAFEVYGVMDDYNRAKLRDYFRKWGYEKEFEEYIEEIANDYWSLSVEEYMEKWG